MERGACEGGGCFGVHVGWEVGGVEVDCFDCPLQKLRAARKIG